MIAEASKQPLYVTDDGEPIYMEDVIAVGGAARLRAISGAAKPIQDAFFKMIHKLKLGRHRAGKPPINAAKVVDKAAVPAAVATVGLSDSAKFPGEGESFIPTPPASAEGLLAAEQSDEVRNLYRGAEKKGLLATGEEAVVEDAVVVDVDKAAKEEKSTVKGSEDIDDETRSALERTWGKHTYNPAQRRKKYMAQLKNIYQKAAWLDAIAAISGGKSRSASYIQRAVGMMEAMQMFDQEERVYNIWRDVYYDKNGNYDPPKSKKEAAERARRLGANPEETKSIYGWTEEGEDLQQWYRYDEDGELEVTTVKGKKTKPKGDGWIMGKPPATSTTATTHVNWTDGDRTITLEKGQTPQGVGHPGDWYKGKAGEPDKTSVRSIDFSENAYQKALDAGDDDETARSKAAYLLFLQTKHDPDMYVYLQGVTDPTQQESARLKINNIIDDYLKRGSTPYTSAGQRDTESPAATPVKEYATLAEAEAAAKAGTLEKKDRVIIGGVPGRWE